MIEQIQMERMPSLPQEKLFPLLRPIFELQHGTLRYDGLSDINGNPETVAMHVRDCIAVSQWIRGISPTLREIINFDEVEGMLLVHDAGETRNKVDYSVGQSHLEEYQNYRIQYDGLEGEHFFTNVLPLVPFEHRPYVASLYTRFEDRKKLGDLEGLMARVIDKVQPLLIFDRGLIYRDLQYTFKTSKGNNFDQEAFHKKFPDLMEKTFEALLNPLYELLTSLWFNPQAQNEVLTFIGRDVLDRFQGWYGEALDRACRKKFGIEYDQLFDSGRYFPREEGRRLVVPSMVSREEFK